MNDDILRLLLCLFINIPLSSLLPFMPNRFSKEIYSLVLSICLQWTAFGTSIWVIYIQQIIAFYLLKQRRGGLVTLQGMAMVSLFHLYQIVYNYGGWTMDASALLMILVCKYSLLAYALQDGTTPQPQLTDQQKKHRITADVSLWDFIGYTNFLPTCIVGPPFQYIDYMHYMNQTNQYANVPNRSKLVLKTIGQALLVGGVYLLGETFCSLNHLKQDSFLEKNVMIVGTYAFFSVMFLRFKYYTGWKISLSAVHASGLSYNGKDFLKINGCDPLVVQTSLHLREKINNWNICVQEWLRKCIYERSSFKSKFINQLYVFFVSSLWHGFYFGYYVSFVAWFMQLYLQTLLFKYFKEQNVLVKMYNKYNPYTLYLGVIIVNAFFNLNGVYFLIIEEKYCWKYFIKMCGMPLLALPILIIIFTLLPSKKKKE